MDSSIDIVDLTLVVLTLVMLKEEMDTFLKSLQSQLAENIREQQQLVRSLPMDNKKRVLWSNFSTRVSDIHFWQMFRMSSKLFSMLCNLICDKIGVSTFRPESYLLEQMQSPSYMDRYSIPGELKLAVCICLFAGGSYLDLVPLFSISTGYIYKIFDEFLYWILHTFEFPLVGWLRDRNWKALHALRQVFAEKSNGIYDGVFSALDGLALRVRCPPLSEVPDPGNYYCRKGFYALNIQALCCKWKRFLWVYSSNKGSTHDSAAFANSQLIDLLNEMSDKLYEQRLSIVGNSAYVLSSFLQVPYDAAEMKYDPENAKDSYNYHLSACQIYIECTFGELVMRWGIFWRTLNFDLKNSPKLSKCE